MLLWRPIKGASLLLPRLPIRRAEARAKMEAATLAMATATQATLATLAAAVEKKVQ